MPSQKMLESWLIDEDTKNFVNNISQTLSYDFTYYGIFAGQDEINQTQNTQPLLVLNSLISFDKLKNRLGFVLPFFQVVFKK